MVTQRPLQDGAAIRDLAGQNTLGDLSRECGIVSLPILLTPQKHIAGHGSLNSRQKPAMLRQKAQCHIIFRAKSHQKRAARNIAETDNPADGMDGNTQANLTVNLDDNGLAFLGEIRSLRGHIKGVQMFFHIASIIFFK
ncbi:MAG: hypothetical protein A4E64_01867 [Syntrophorhabdus sp. PtaU1.Bin058]|nr:MAG: hypothetical protein A4E64_01867 [Syntrophorhabdus sp. PtaU1.Bin058]